MFFWWSPLWFCKRAGRSSLTSIGKLIFNVLQPLPAWKLQSLGTNKEFLESNARKSQWHLQKTFEEHFDRKWSRLDSNAQSKNCQNTIQHNQNLCMRYMSSKRKNFQFLYTCEWLRRPNLPLRDLLTPRRRGLGLKQLLGHNSRELK